MARKTNNLTPEVFATESIDLYEKLTAEITAAQMKVDSMAEVVGTALSRIQAKELFKIGGYKNVYDYAADKHGISRGTVSDAINVAKRFFLEDGSRKPEYKEYKWSNLKFIKGLTDKEIELYGINAAMTGAQIKEAISKGKAIADKRNEEWHKYQALESEARNYDIPFETPQIDATYQELKSLNDMLEAHINYNRAETMYDALLEEIQAWLLHAPSDWNYDHETKLNSALEEVERIRCSDMNNATDVFGLFNAYAKAVEGVKAVMDDLSIYTPLHKEPISSINEPETAEADAKADNSSINEPDSESEAVDHGDTHEIESQADPQALDDSIIEVNVGGLSGEDLRQWFMDNMDSIIECANSSSRLVINF